VVPVKQGAPLTVLSGTGRTTGGSPPPRRPSDTGLPGSPSRPPGRNLRRNAIPRPRQIPTRSTTRWGRGTTRSCLSGRSCSSFFTKMGRETRSRNSRTSPATTHSGAGRWPPRRPGSPGGPPSAPAPPAPPAPTPRDRRSGSRSSAAGRCLVGPPDPCAAPDSAGGCGSAPRPRARSFAGRFPGLVDEAVGGVHGRVALELLGASLLDGATLLPDHRARASAYQLPCSTTLA